MVDGNTERPRRRKRDTTPLDPRLHPDILRRLAADFAAPPSEESTQEHGDQHEEPDPEERGESEVASG